MNIQAASSFYLRGRRGREEVIIFQGKDDLSEFAYKSETVSRFGRSGTEGVLDRAGILSVKEYGTFIFGRSPTDADAEPFEERFYRLGAASIPDVLAQLVYGEVLAGDCEQIMIDVVRTDGTIVPVVISRPQSGQRNTDKKGGYVLKLDFLDRRDSYSEIHLDEEQVIFKEVLREGTTYILERSNPEEVRRLFPEKANEIIPRGAE
jgi:hypothetical protein